MTKLAKIASFRFFRFQITIAAGIGLFPDKRLEKFFLDLGEIDCYLPVFPLIPSMIFLYQFFPKISSGLPILGQAEPFGRIAL